MKNDEQAIRGLVQTWLDASKRGDYATVLHLMADDVVFLVPGQEPFGKENWVERMKGIQVDGQSEIQEITIAGEWAWMRQRLRMTVAQVNAKPSVLSGHSLAIFHRKPDGRWVLARDANLLTPEAEKKGEPL